MATLKHIAVYLPLLFLLSPTAFPEKLKPVNKLQQMFHLYYLPFTIEFREGKSTEEIFPFTLDKYREFTRLIKPDELQLVDADWDKIRAEWKKKSLLLGTPVAINESLRISPRLASHRIPLTRNAWHGLSMEERMQFEEALRGKSDEVKKKITQLRLLRSFMKSSDDEKFNLFVVGPSWCESSREYKAIIEAYFKKFDERELVFHSITIDDPREEIFDSQLMTALFPNPEKYSHDIVPRFLAIQSIQGETALWEEGEALVQLYERFFKSKRGFLDKQIANGKSLFNTLPIVPDTTLSMFGK